MGDKLFVGAEQFLLDSFRLAKRVHSSGFRPDFLIGIWRGGTPVGIVVHEYLKWKGLDPFHTAIKTESYTGVGKRGLVDVSGVEPVLRMMSTLNRPSKVLLVDDVFDTGRSMKKVIDLLNAGARHEPEVRMATVYFKPKGNQTSLKPDFYLHEADAWIVFPHEIVELTPEELAEKDGPLSELLSEH